MPALARSLHGRNRVARALLSWAKLGARIPGASLRPVEVNGMPGGLLLDGEGRLVGVWELEIWGGEIQAVNSVVNPEKLAHLGPLADMRALLRETVGRGGAGPRGGSGGAPGGPRGTDGSGGAPGGVTSSDTTPR